MRERRGRSSMTLSVWSGSGGASSPACGGISIPARNACAAASSGMWRSHHCITRLDLEKKRWPPMSMRLSR